LVSKKPKDVQGSVEIVTFGIKRCTPKANGSMIWLNVTISTHEGNCEKTKHLARDDKDGNRLHLGNLGPIFFAVGS